MLTKKQFDDSIVALKSGKYKQTHDSFLRVKEDGEDCFCAMGVIVDSVDPNAWKLEPGYNDYSWNNKCGMAPRDVLSKSVQVEIITLNDDHEKSFEYIANWMLENEKSFVEEC
jgi:hypothetical protein